MAGIIGNEIGCMHARLLNDIDRMAVVIGLAWHTEVDPDFYDVRMIWFCQA